MDAADCVPLPAGAASGAPVCPRADGAVAAANVTNKKKSRCLCMLNSFSFAVSLFLSERIAVREPISPLRSFAGSDVAGSATAPAVKCRN
jgi:hypothetical protein